MLLLLLVAVVVLGGGGALTSGSAACHVLREKELANRFYNGTLAAVTQPRKPLSLPNTSVFDVQAGVHANTSSHVTPDRKRLFFKNGADPPQMSRR